jgi:hypothetical protein
MDQNVDVHTNGAGTASNVNGANQTGATHHGLGNRRGHDHARHHDHAPGRVCGQSAVAPVHRPLMNFIITADVAQGATTLPISPAIVTSGAFQNVSASPTTAQPFVILGAASTVVLDERRLPQGRLHARDGADGEAAGRHGCGASQRSEDGFTLKVTEFYDGINDASVMRIDVLFGWAATYPELSTKYYTLNQ